MIEVNDIIINHFMTWRVIEAEPENDYVIVLMQTDVDGLPVDQDEDNIGDFILKNDIYEGSLG